MEYVIVFLLVGVFIAVIVILAMKERKVADEMVSKLTEEQKLSLMSPDVEFVKKNAWVQKAMVANVKEKGNKTEVRLFWYNEVINNGEYHKITIADAQITKEEQEEHHLQYGDYVKMYFDPKKPELKIVWE